MATNRDSRKLLGPKEYYEDTPKEAHGGMKLMGRGRRWDLERSSLCPEAGSLAAGLLVVAFVQKGGGLQISGTVNINTRDLIIRYTHRGSQRKAVPGLGKREPKIY